MGIQENKEAPLALSGNRPPSPVRGSAGASSVFRGDESRCRRAEAWSPWKGAEEYCALPHLDVHSKIPRNDEFAKAMFIV